MDNVARSDRAEMSILDVRGLTVDFPSHDGILQAVRGVDFTLQSGECLGIVGESGSGKSVSALAALGLLGKDARVGGSILLKGAEVRGLGPEQLRALRGTVASMIFQEPSRSFDPISSIGKTFQETLRVKDPISARASARPGPCASSRRSTSRAQRSGFAAFRTSSPAGCSRGS